MTSVEARLQLLEDERAIMQVLTVYGHAYDYGLEEEFADCWTDDAVLTYPDAPVLQGRPQIREFFRGHTHFPEARHHHMVVDPRIQLDGDRAAVESYFMRVDGYPDGPHIRSFGRYIDVLVRGADGAWRFLERTALLGARRGR
jgi:uncharacterized protein (TIGR02246 family)